MARIRRSQWITSPVSTPLQHRLVMSSEEEFKDTLLNYFRPLINARHINWKKLIRRSKKRFDPYLSSQSSSSIFREMLLSVFEVTQCTEYEVIREALQDFMIIKLRGSYHLVQDCIYKHPSYLRSSEDVPHFIANFYGSNCRITVDFLYTPALVLNLYATQRLLRFGIPFGFSYFQMRCAAHMLFAIIMFRLLPLHFEIDYPIYGSVENDGRRFYLVMLTLCVILRKMKAEFYPDSHDSISGVKLLFESIKDPYVTLMEVLRFFIRSLGRGYARYQSKVVDICTNVAMEFPYSKEPLQPRSLMHLSRCEVRRCLGTSKKLPNGVWGLRIPETLKNYILLQNKREEFYPKYVSELRN